MTVCYSVDMKKFCYPEVGSRWELRTIPYPDCVVEVVPQGFTNGLVHFKMSYGGIETMHTLAYAWFYAAHIPLDKYREKGE